MMAFVLAIFTTLSLPSLARNVQCALLKPDMPAVTAGAYARLWHAWRKGRCKRVIAIFQRVNRRTSRHIRGQRKRCKAASMDRVVEKTVYRANPAVVPGLLGLVPSSEPAMATAWCLCRAKKYKQAMDVLQNTALFGWSTRALPAYAYLLSVLKGPKYATGLLRYGCQKNDKKCTQIMQIIQNMSKIVPNKGKKPQ